MQNDNLNKYIFICNLLRSKNLKTGEEALWQAVLCQIFEDIAITSQNKRKISIAKKSKKWLKENPSDLLNICLNAGINAKALLLIMNNFDDL